MDLIIDIHTHTVSSGHAYSTLEENVKSASQKGIKLLAVTDHAPALPGSVTEIYFSNFRVIPREMMGVEIFMGAELNILDEKGTIDLPEKLLKRLDLCIASLHTLCISPKSIKENTNAILGAMENPYVQVIGHPGDPHYATDLLEIAKASKRTGTLLELNNASLNPNGSRIGSDLLMKELLGHLKKLDIPVVFGTDSHFSAQIGDFEAVTRLVEECGFPWELVLNTDVLKFKDSLKK